MTGVGVLNSYKRSRKAGGREARPPGFSRSGESATTDQFMKEAARATTDQTMKEGVDIMKMICKLVLIAVLLSAISICGRELWTISRQYAEEAQLKSEISRYRPEPPKPQDAQGVAGIRDGIDSSNTSGSPQGRPADTSGISMEDGSNQSEAPEKIVNQSIADMQYDISADIVGWITIPNTRIDYPFVIAEDNDFYLRRNIYKQQAVAGSIYMDYRCAKDFTDSNTVIYGHNMKNRSMFGDLRLFADPGFFESNATGTLFVKDNTYELEIFAYMVVRFDDKLVYDPSSDREQLIGYAQKCTSRYREPAALGNIVTLSTCAYNYDGARMVLLAVIVP